MAGEREPCGCWGECSHPACLTGPSGVCCRMREPAPSPDPAALWALVRRWREDMAMCEGISTLTFLRGRAHGLQAAANELAALLPPEGT